MNIEPDNFALYMGARAAKAVDEGCDQLRDAWQVGQRECANAARRWFAKEDTFYEVRRPRPVWPTLPVMLVG